MMNENKKEQAMIDRAKEIVLNVRKRFCKKSDAYQIARKKEVTDYKKAVDTLYRLALNSKNYNVTKKAVLAMVGLLRDSEIKELAYLTCRYDDTWLNYEDEAVITGLAMIYKKEYANNRKDQLQ